MRYRNEPKIMKSQFTDKELLVIKVIRHFHRTRTEIMNQVGFNSNREIKRLYDECIIDKRPRKRDAKLPEYEEFKVRSEYKYLSN